MRHFIAYHNADRMGYADIERMRVLTNKPVSDDMIGDHIWLFVGKGERSKNYFLGSHFVIDDLAKGESGDFDHQLTGHDGRIFGPMIELDGLDWFEDFRKSVQNFSLGLRQIKDQRIVHELEKLAASVEDGMS